MAVITGDASGTQQPWYTFPRIDNFGTIDPAGPYWKPDSNVQLPGGYPITALLSGVVTDVRQTTYGQTMVTVKLDTPLNSLATHTFYEHMSSSTVQVGQRVSAGQLIGYNNPQGAVPLGFGLYSGDQYGNGSAWQALQSDLAPGGKGLLNPTALLDAAKGGKSYTPASSTSTGRSGGGSMNLLDPSTWLPTIKAWGEYLAIFVLALVLIIMGFVLLAEKQATQVAKAAIA